MLSSPVSEYFDGVADTYNEHYNPDYLLDMTRPYPANYFRMQLLKKSFADRANVIDVGCGDGTTTQQLWWAQVCGLDVSPRMIEKCNSERAIVADIMRPETYEPLIQYAPFDGLVAMGVMPHIEDTEQALHNMQTLVHGKVFIEFRNDLFNLFAMNDGTAEFISRMIEKPGASEYAKYKLKSLLPKRKERAYDRILSKFHNPFEIRELFERLGFSDIRLLWYHYHPTLPWLADDNDILFREDAIAMEGQPETWKSMFQCSAFVVEAYSG